MKDNIRLGFIGQGWIGKNLADHFEERGFSTVRYAKEAEHEKNKDTIAECDIVFVAVPTPSTPQGFDDSILRSVLPLVGKGKTVVIKSTIVPGTTDSLSDQYPDIFVFHAPEFLRETSVRLDIDRPDRNIVGVPSKKYEDTVWKKRAQHVLDIMPDAPYSSICMAPEAELTKYGGNNFLYMKVIYMNLMYDLAQHYGVRFDSIAKNMTADPRIGDSHMEPVHQNSHMGDCQGRGAGGHCFIKDFAAFREIFEKDLSSESESILLLRSFEAKNNKLLRDTNKDIELLNDVYGSDINNTEE